MSSAPTQLAVAPSAPSLVAPTAQIQKDFLEEPLTRQNSLGNRVRGGLKGKHLTRSYAMRESASPPHTPTPRSDHLSPSPVSGFSSSNETINDSKVHVQSSSSPPSSFVSMSTSGSSNQSIDTPSVVIVTTTITSQQQQTTQKSHSPIIMYSNNNDSNNIGVNNNLNNTTNNVVCNQSQLDVDFPKLTPPKSSKCSRNPNMSREQQQFQQPQQQQRGIDNCSDKQQQQQQFGINNEHNTLSYNNTNSNSSMSYNITTEAVTNVNPTLNGNKNMENSNTMTISKQSNSHTNSNHNNINNNNNNNNLNTINNNTNNMTTNNNNNNNNSNSMDPCNPLNPVVNQSTSPNIHRNHNHHQHHHHHHQHQQSQTIEQNCNINNSSITANSSPNSEATVSPPLLSYDKENRCSRNNNGCNMGNGINNCNNIGGNNDTSCPYLHDENENNMSESPTDNSSKCDRLGKKHRSGANAKGSKPRLKNMGSSSSVEGGNSTSGFISRDSSTEQYTDQNGVDLLQFFKETLNKNPKDRSMLMKIEKDLIQLAHDKIKTEIRFPVMSSYNRMLIHRVAAFFGMEHNVDNNAQQSVVVTSIKSSRIPDIRFKSLLRDRMSDEPRKSILKRDTHSFDDTRHGLLICPDRGLLDRKAKSFEEREEEYEKVRRRIFRGREFNEMTEEHYWPWSSTDSSDQSARFRQNNKLLKVQSLSIDTRPTIAGRPSVSKSYSFGGYGGPPQSGSGCGPLSRGDSVNSTKSAGPRLFSKQDSIGSTNTPWRLSPSSSGYKTQTQSLRSDSVTPSPTGYGSDDHTPEPSVVQSPPAASCGVVWAVTDMASVPRGSVLINPQTLQPIVNQDGSLYHFDPSNLPPSQAITSVMYNNNNNNNNNNNHKTFGGNNGGGGGPPNSYNRKKGGDKQQQQQTQQHQQNKIENKSNEIQYNNANNNNNQNNGSNNTGNNNNSNSGGDSNSASTAGNESSGENLSESSAQTVLNVGSTLNNNGGNGDDDEDDSNRDIHNHNHHHRDMSDIQEESFTQSIEDIDKPITTSTNTDNLSDIQQKPKLINQATSPKIPSPEPDQRSQIVEVVTTTLESTSESNSIENTTTINTINTNNNATVNPTPVAASTTSQQEINHKKEDPKPAIPNVPVTSYTGYQAPDGSTIFTPPSSAHYPTTTTYQPGPDGSVYAVPQSMVYAYPPPMDGEIQGYFMPVYDQGAAQRDANALMPATAQAIYQSASGTTAVVPVAYPSAPYGGAPLYQSQVIYTPDQFGTAATTAQQYPVTTYPMGYPYPYNGYWGQPMTYYVPQHSLGNAVPSSIIPPPISGNHSHNNNIGKRNTPPQQSLSSGHNSQSATPASTYQFTPGVPLALTTDPSGPTMYAIPQSAVFSNMLPYAPQTNAASATTGVLSHLPHQHNSVINPLIATHPSGHTGPPIPLEPQSSCGGFGLATTITNSSGNHGNNNGTPQSAPSTPLSNPLPLAHHQRNPPLFATPPIMPNGYNTQMHNHYHNYAVDAQIGGCNTFSSYDKKNSNNGGKKGGNNSNISNNNGGANGGNGYISHGRQNSYSHNNQHLRRTNMNDNSTHPSSNQNGNNRSIHISQQKRINNDKTSNIGTINVGSGLGTSGCGGNNIPYNNNNNNNSNNSCNNLHNNSDKPRTGIRPKPGNLDLRRSASQRNSPSTNSVESSNNSPNSIASNHMNIATSMAANSTSSSIIENQQSMYKIEAHKNWEFFNRYGMYFKYGQTYFAHPSMALPNNRRSPPSELRPPLTPLAGVYPTVNMMLPAPRQMHPRHPNPNYKGNKPSR